MKFFSLSLVFCVLLLNQTGFGQDFTLDVLNGSIVGSQQYGNPIHIYANPTQEGRIFSGWKGPDADKLTLPDEWHTTFIATANDGNTFNLRASYDSLGNADFGEMEFPGFTQTNSTGLTPEQRRVIFAVPPAEEVKAFVFMIHGTNGAASDWSERYEQQAVRKDLVHNGYAVFAIDANEKIVGDQNGDGAERWMVNAQASDTTTNIDLKNIIALERFVKGFLGDKPVFVYGGSNGANFADFSAAMLNYTGVCHMISNGNSWLYNQTQINLKPAIWIQSRNDQNASSDSLIAKANYQSLVNRGLPTEWFWLDKAPGYASRFVRSLEPISLMESSRVWDELQTAGYIDSDGFLTINRVKSDFDDQAFFNNATFSEAQQAEIINQLEILNAEHTPHSDYSKQVIRFFDSLLQGISATREAQKAIQGTVFPNPTSDFVTLQAEQESSYTLLLRSSIGNWVHSETFSGNSHSISLSELPSGVYFLLVEDLENGGIHTARIVKR